MKTSLKLIVALAAMMLLVVPAFAQEAPIEPGTGAPIVEPNFGSDVATLNPIIYQDGTSERVILRIFPKLINWDPFTGGWAEDADGALAESWEISEDGLTYTFSLSDEWVWSDGTPITANDFVYFWSIADGEGVSPRTDFINQVAEFRALDDYTLEVEFEEAVCTALDALHDVYAVPSATFEELFSDDYQNMQDSDFNLNMPVSGSSFVFANYRPGEQVTTLANQAYPDSFYEEGVIPAGWILKTVTDQVVQMEQFFAGDLTYVASVPDSFKQEVRDRAANGEFQFREVPSTSIRFLSLNLADPTNPQNGLDEDGNPIDQGNHPVLGDVRVRQAMAHAIQYDDINQGVFFGSGVQVASMVLPQSWANPGDLEPYAFDLELAGQLLDDAGWTDSDGDGVRECNGCQFAEEGAPLAITVGTNAGNTSQEALYTILQDQWEEIGFEIDLQFLDFNTLVEQLTGQTYDALGVFWGFSTPDNPDGELTGVFMPESDVVGTGFNTHSYNNPEFNALVEQARTLPGCDQEERAELYGQAFQILRDDLPWLFLSGSSVMLAAQPDVENWDPAPASSRWNITGWVAEQR